MDTKIIYSFLSNAKSDLHRVSYDSIKKVMDQIPMKDLLGIRIPQGSVIFRSRPSEDYEFSSVDELSYPKVTDRFCRAHRPGNPMFYGAIANGPEEDYLDQLAQIFTEALEPIRFKLQNEGEKDLTIGRWINNKDLIVFAMVFHDPYFKKNTYIKKLYNDYMNFINTISKDHPKLLVLKLISDEFAKTIISEDNDYKISAAFVESVLQRSLIDIDGIIYPSVRCEGENINIALTPKCVNTKLSLTNVVTTTLYYKEKVILNDYLKEAKLLPGEKTFTLTEIVDPNIHFGKELALKHLVEQINIKNKLNLL